MHDTGKTKKEPGEPDAGEPTKVTRTVIGVAVAVAVAGGIVGILWALDWPRFLFLGYVATKIGIKVGVAAFAGVLALIAWWRGRRAKRQEEQPPPAEAPTD